MPGGEKRRVSGDSVCTNRVAEREEIIHRLCNSTDSTNWHHPRPADRSLGGFGNAVRRTQRWPPAHQPPSTSHQPPSTLYSTSHQSSASVAVRPTLARAATHVTAGVAQPTSLFAPWRRHRMLTSPLFWLQAVHVSAVSQHTPNHPELSSIE